MILRRSFLFPPGGWFSSFLSLVLIAGLAACGGEKKRILQKNPRLQRFTDQTRLWMPQISGPIRKALFARADGDETTDLLVLKQAASGPPVMEVWLNPDKERFLPAPRSWTGRPGDRIEDMQVGFFNRDMSHEVVLIGRFEDGSRAKLLFNNGRGYFYEDDRVSLPMVREGMRRINVLDLDQDHNLDLLLFPMGGAGKGGAGPPENPLQFLLGRGEGRFQDRTRLLWPPLPPGVAGGVYADYDNDHTLDVYLYYENGQNRLLVNNGLGKLKDITRTHLPPLRDKTLHADWADFDLDGDQDLLVVNRELDRRHRAFEREHHYALENNGQGYFTKKTLKALPPFPASGSYLLDADGDEWADLILVTSRGTHYLRGTGKWRFSLETRKRLPSGPVFADITFADINDDGYLDLFGVTPQGRGYLWVNTF